MLSYQLLQEVYGGTVGLCWLLVGSYFGKESAVHLLGNQLTVSVKTVSVGICDPLEFWVAMNMIYSDYAKVAEK